MGLVYQHFNCGCGRRIRIFRRKKKERTCRKCGRVWQLAAGRAVLVYDPATAIGDPVDREICDSTGVAQGASVALGSVVIGASVAIGWYAVPVVWHGLQTVLYWGLVGAAVLAVLCTIGALVDRTQR